MHVSPGSKSVRRFSQVVRSVCFGCNKVAWVFLFAAHLPVASALTWKVINPPLAANEIVVYGTQNPAAAPVPGAVADGTTDNTAAFQNAMNILHAGGGGVLYVPAGHYAFTGNLNVPAGVTIHGDWKDWSTGT